METDEAGGDGRPGAVATAAAAAAAATADSRQLTMPAHIPSTMHLCVEFPGYVGDEQRVLETLGGLGGLARQLRENPKTLPLKLRPRDKNCHATFGQREGSRRVLLKLTRPAPRVAGSSDGGGAGGSEGAGAGEWSAELVATLPYTYRFTQPADFQYVAIDTRPVEEQGLEQQQDVSLPGFQPQPLLCPPPLFAKQPMFDYAFKGYIATQAPGTSGPAATVVSGGKRRVGAGVMASFFDVEVPQPLPEAAIAASGRFYPDALRLLRQLLQQRAVWPAAALHEAFVEAGGGPASGSGKSGIDELLPKLCYKFRNGPWKNAWTRRGFDPRNTPAARLWQCIEYHLPSEWYSKIAERKKSAALAKSKAGSQQKRKGGAAASAAAAAAGEASPAGGEPREQEGDSEGAAAEGTMEAGVEEEGEAQQQQQASRAEEDASQLPPLAGSYRHLLRFEAVPSTQSCSLQLGWLADSVVHEVLADPANHSQHCTDTSGWLASAAYDSIKRRIKERFQAVLDGAPIQDDFQPPEQTMGVQQQQGPRQQQRQEGQQHQQQQVQQQGAQQGQQQQQGGQEEEEQQGGKKRRRRRRGKGKVKEAGEQQNDEQQQQQEQQQQGQGRNMREEGEGEPMEIDAGAGGKSPAGASGPLEVNELAQQAQQQLHIQPPAAAAAAADGAPAAAAGPSPQQQGPRILPTGLMADLAHYLSHLPERDEEDEDEGDDDEEDEEEGREGYQTDEREGYQTDEGYQTEEGVAGGGQDDEEG